MKKWSWSGLCLEELRQTTLQLSPPSCYLPLQAPVPCSRTLSVCVISAIWKTMFHTHTQKQGIIKSDRRCEILYTFHHVLSLVRVWLISDSTDKMVHGATRARDTQHNCIFRTNVMSASQQTILIARGQVLPCNSSTHYVLAKFPQELPLLSANILTMLLSGGEVPLFIYWSRDVSTEIRGQEYLTKGLSYTILPKHIGPSLALYEFQYCGIQYSVFPIIRALPGGKTL